MIFMWILEYLLELQLRIILLYKSQLLFVWQNKYIINEMCPTHAGLEIVVAVQ